MYKLEIGSIEGDAYEPKREFSSYIHEEGATVVVITDNSRRIYNRRFNAEFKMTFDKKDLIERLQSFVNPRFNEEWLDEKWLDKTFLMGDGYGYRITKIDG